MTVKAKESVFELPPNVQVWTKWNLVIQFKKGLRTLSNHLRCCLPMIILDNVNSTMRKHKENQTRPYGLHASFLPLVGLPLAVPLPEKLKKRKGSSGSVERTYQSRDPEGYTHQSSDPEGCTYQSSALEGCTYQSSAPEGCTYQSSAPEGCTYQSSAPEGCTYP
ncbi:NBS-LRR type resistance protein [Cucumis melo var. makuwa]|uniref:NBS-LRR type resistance protein n=1 Tax=Cucumis melo var. makuwa TaxID=1194695 RepID=A0A5A7T460_CUCMM|nr:NBS-LRR type resistance protein [Cucumis melo var. makuwa]TYK30653.1 NBS-LRR type resistance protein [Cucumis melo var. makuwa]